MSLRTEYPFTLPKGFVDQEGTLHRKGVMRLATARDELEPLRDPRVQGNEAFATVIVLAKVVTSLGSLRRIDTDVIDGLFVGDFNYLQDVYRMINFEDPSALVEAEPGAPLERAEAR